MENQQSSGTETPLPWLSLSYLGQREGCFENDVSDQLMSLLKQRSGVTHICLPCVWVQQNVTSTTIYPSFDCSPNRTDLVHAIVMAQKLNLKVILHTKLKLIDSCSPVSDSPKICTVADIGKYFTTDAQWTQWFASYESYVRMIATIAQSYQVPMMIIGSELTGTEHCDEQWKHLIANIRQRYSGALCYGASLENIISNNPSYSHVPAWQYKDLDYLGYAVFIPLLLSNKNTISTDATVSPSVGNTDSKQRTNEQLSLDALCLAWKPILNGLQQLSARYGRKIIITEIGFPSRADAPYLDPRLAVGAVDEQMQSLCYKAFFKALCTDRLGIEVFLHDTTGGVVGTETSTHAVMSGPSTVIKEDQTSRANSNTWLSGINWYYWSSDFTEYGPADSGFTPAGKSAVYELQQYASKQQ